MSRLFIITPVKDSLETTRRTVESIFSAKGNNDYCVFNDLSGPETTRFLEENQETFDYQLINLGDYVDTPSPNYGTTLRMAQEMALEKHAHLVIVESDVMVEQDTFKALQELAAELENVGMIGVITVDEQRKINFPYNHISEKDPDLFITDRSLSFCCTLLSRGFLSSYNFDQLNPEKDWYDVSISKKSRSMGFDNYLTKQQRVLHLPHSSRPWKMEKYSNPISYYFKKFFLKRDKI